ncbi:DUF211 domain-containing protein [Natronoglomus mannanivorans]|uniref:DUF211 domain-containing protein n=1 Tax=Natronoglomus mannanivorans TaxID=2979990 RepID=UPI003CCE2FFB
MSNIRRLKLSAIFPRTGRFAEYAQQFADDSDVNSVNTTLIHATDRILFVVVTVEGTDIDREELYEQIRNFGGAVHLPLEVDCGSYTLDSDDSYGPDLDWTSIDRNGTLEL